MRVTWPIYFNTRERLSAGLNIIVYTVDIEAYTRWNYNNQNFDIHNSENFWSMSLETLFAKWFTKFLIYFSKSARVLLIFDPQPPRVMKKKEYNLYKTLVPENNNSISKISKQRSIRSRVIDLTSPRKIKGENAARKWAWLV